MSMQYVLREMRKVERIIQNYFGLPMNFYQFILIFSVKLLLH
jgi:hypothetical protein